MSNHTPKPIQIPLPLDGETIEIPLNLGYSTIIDAIDADLAQTKWYANSSKTGIYVVGNYKANGKWKSGLRLHRLVAEKILNRKLVKNEFVDHIDGNTFNNRRSNLRVCTHSENVMNKRRYSKNKSGYKGVHKVWRRYIAQIQVNKKKIFLGSFDTPELAYEAYCKAAKEYFGEFARFE